MVESFIVMLQTNSEIKPPVGVIESLTGGFETTASRLPAVFFPLAFDLFLWLGPRLSINPLIQQLIALVNSAPAQDAASDQNRRAIVEMWRIMGRRQTSSPCSALGPWACRVSWQPNCQP